MKTETVYSWEEIYNAIQSPQWSDIFRSTENSNYIIYIMFQSGIKFYIVFQGGIKAVIWTDTLQTIIMFSGMMAVIIQGFINLGWSRVWKDATDSGRLDLFEWEIKTSLLIYLAKSKFELLWWVLKVLVGASKYITIILLYCYNLPVLMLCYGVTFVSILWSGKRYVP